jgi:hypothetical protein
MTFPITTERFLSIERTVLHLSGQLKPIVKPEVANDLQAAAFFMSVLRSHADTFYRTDTSQEDKEAALQDLLTSIYRHTFIA